MVDKDDNIFCGDDREEEWYDYNDYIVSIEEVNLDQEEEDDDAESD